MAAAIQAEDLETYVAQYGTYGAIQRLQFIAQSTDCKLMKFEAYRQCLDLLKRTTNTKGYVKVHQALKELAESDDTMTSVPSFDSVWVEATAKQAAILKDVYEQDLHSAKGQQIKETIRSCHNQIATFCTQQGDYVGALRNISKSREYCSEPRAVFMTCMSIIHLNALLAQYADIQSFANKALHTPYKEDSTADKSKIAAAHGLYHLTSRQYKDAALNFAQVKAHDLATSSASCNFMDVLCPQDIAVYGVLTALASLDRNEVQTRLLGSASFCECLDLVPQLRELTNHFCGCRYAACLASLDRLRPSLELDVHMSGLVTDVCQQIRSKGIVQYFAPYLSVSLHAMAEAFNTDVDGIQTEVAQLVGSRQLDARIDSHKKILHMRHSNQRKAAYQNALRVSQEYLDTTRALVLRMNLLKRDFGVDIARPKK